jgi:hypothetical protein
MLPAGNLKDCAIQHFSITLLDTSDRDVIVHHCFDDARNGFAEQGSAERSGEPRLLAARSA